MGHKILTCLILIGAAAPLPPATARDLAMSDLYRKVVHFYDAGDYPSARKMGEEVLHITQAFFKGNHPDIGLCLNNLAGIERAMGDYRKSEASYKRALKIYCKYYGSGHAEVAAVMNNLGVLYLKLGWISRAETLLFRSSWIIGSKLSPANPIYHKSLSNVAELYRARGITGKAMELHNRAYALRTYFRGEESPETMDSLSDRAETYRADRQFRQAIKDQLRVLKSRQRLLGSDHPDTAVSHHRLSVVYRQKQEYPAALQEAQSALSIRERKLGPDHPDTADTLFNLALIYRETGRLDIAEDTMVRALRIRRAKLRRHHSDTLLAEDLLLVIRQERSEQAFQAARLVTREGLSGGRVYDRQPGSGVTASPLRGDSAAQGPVGRFGSAGTGTNSAVSGVNNPKAATGTVSSLVADPQGALEPTTAATDTAEKPGWFQRISSWMNLSDVNRVMVQTQATNASVTPERSSKTASVDPSETIREMENQVAEYRAKGLRDEAEATLRLVRRLKKQSGMAS